MTERKTNAANQKVSVFSRFFICLFLLIALRPAMAQPGGMPAAQLAALKAATTFVQVDLADGWASGSGFLISKDGDAGYIATNAHVVDDEGAAARGVKVVFNSGAAGEQVLRAEVVGQDDDRDIAILRVHSASLPQPLALSSSLEPRETMPVFVLGFPFGEMMATGKKNPAMTITTGTITSIRTDDAGRVTWVQVDADINEGNSGGPVVDSSGGLVGIATAKIEDTKIGLALPPSELAEMLKGRVAAAKYKLTSNQNGVAKYDVTISLIDPLHKLRAASIFLAPQDEKAPLPKTANPKQGPALPQMKEFALKFSGDQATTEITLNGDAAANAVYITQVRVELSNGQMKWTAPSRLLVPFARGGASSDGNTGGNNVNSNTGRNTKPSQNTPRTPAPGKGKQNGQPASGGGWIEDAEEPDKNAGQGTSVSDSGRELLRNARTVVDASVQQVGLSAAEIIPNLLWSPDGKYLYVLEKKGFLRKISVPGFQEEKVLEMGQAGSFMAMSKLGLVVASVPNQEVWLVDAASLAVKKRIGVGGMTGLAASPVLNTAYVSQGETLAIVDLAAGKVVSKIKAFEVQQEFGDQISKHEESMPLSDFDFPSVTPDGRYFLCESSESLHRFSINKNELFYEEAGPRIGQNAQRIEISADSKYVALPSGGGNYEVSAHPKTGPYSTYVYKVADLLKPIVAISSGAYPRVLGFDKAGGKLLAQNYQDQLIVFTPKGIREKSYHLLGNMGQNSDVNQILAHPSGNKVLVLTEKSLLWVELPAAS